MPSSVLQNARVGPPPDESGRLAILPLGANALPLEASDLPFVIGEQRLDSRKVEQESLGTIIALPSSREPTKPLAYAFGNSTLRRVEDKLCPSQKGGIGDGCFNLPVDLIRLYDAAASASENLPRGCMISLSGRHQGPDLAPIRDMMTEYRAASEVYLAARIRKGIRDGDMPGDIDVDALAAFVNAIVRGLAVQARDGASRSKLLNTGRVAMEAWPVTSMAAA